MFGNIGKLGDSRNTRDMSNMPGCTPRPLPRLEGTAQLGRKARIPPPDIATSLYHCSTYVCCFSGLPAILGATYYGGGAKVGGAAPGVWEQPENRRTQPEKPDFRPL